ncbi:hypothetical protein MMC26_006560 [Xylographa opegraphella]|nr:hypothetical protein [Xylographa opegraphella]
MSVTKSAPARTFDGEEPMGGRDAVHSVSKRKRSQDSEEQGSSFGGRYHERAEDEKKKRKDKFDELLIDLLEVMRARDTTLSVFELPIPFTVSEEHSAKRIKLSTTQTAASIASQIEAHAYNHIEELVTDVESVTSSIIENKQDAELSNGSMQYCDNQIKVHQVAAFKKQLEDIIRREKAQDSELLTAISNGNTFPEDSSNTQEEAKMPSPSLGAEVPGGTVLTLYGSAPTPKQLFSSLQEVVRTKSSKASQTSLQNIGLENESFVIEATSFTPPLREAALPNGISTTKIIPVHSEKAVDGKGRPLTFGDVFAPPSNVPPLNPPKQSRHTATRSQSVNWYHPGEVPTPARSNSTRKTYTVQPLSTGQWLAYNVAPSLAQLSTPGEKRKQRDRALSVGESKAALPEETLIAHQQAKDDALFKSAYSSFAPDHDDAAAVVPQQLKNRLWWKRLGVKKYESLLSQDDPDNMENLIPFNEIQNANEDELFKEAVECWEPEEIPADFDNTKKHSIIAKPDDKDVEEILSNVSDLLETMDSYQRVRNLSLAGNARTVASQNAQLTAMTGSPTSPSSEEFDMYKILESQLILIISSLPPYAVAKLNGHHLDALNISTRIQREGKNHKGTMEDYDFVPKARPPVPAAATGSPARTAPQINVSGRSGNYQASLSTPAQRVAYASSARPNAPTATYPTHQYSNRPTPTASQYGSYSAQQPAARNSYSAHQYGTPMSQTHANQYTNGNRQYPAQGYHGIQYNGSQSSASPGPVQGSQYQRPSQPGYQQRAQNSQSYGYGLTSSTARSASPQHPAAAYTAQTPGRAGYTAPATNYVSPRSQLPHAPPSSTASASPLPATNGVAGTIGQQLGLSAEEQAVLMLRNKEMLQRNVMHSPRQESDTSQPTHGQEVGHSNGTSVQQPNGTVADPAGP